jgi:pyruvate/oxaloacetate carboxyltransferase
MSETDSKKVLLTDVTLGDAPLTGGEAPPSTEAILSLAALIDKAGFWSAEVWGAGVFLSSMRELREDPWERLRAIKKVMPSTPLQVSLMGRCLLGSRPFADDVIEALVGKASQGGIEVFRIFHPDNDLENIESVARAVKAAGSHAQGTLTYAESSSHTLEHFVETARALESMGCDSVCMSDPRGLLTPFDASRLVRMVGEVVKVPIHLHVATMRGMAPATCLKAIEAGATAADAALVPAGLQTTPPSAEGLGAMLRSPPHDTGMDPGILEKASKWAVEIFGGKTGAGGAEDSAAGAEEITDMAGLESAPGTGLEDRLGFAFFPDASKAFVAFRERGDTPEEELASVLGAVLARCDRSVAPPAAGVKKSGGKPWGAAGRLDAMGGLRGRREKPGKW